MTGRWAWATMALLAAHLAWGAGPEPAVRKKLIATGWDQLPPKALLAKAAEYDQLPFDGVVIPVPGGLTVPFSADVWKPETFQPAIDDLKALPFKHLTHNFLLVGSNPGNVDWFDDAGWKQVVEHWRIAARVAKQGCVKGILFDPEPYHEPFRQLDYMAQAGRAQHTFAEYCVKARQRGAEVMQAVASEYPDITIYTFFMHSVNATAARQPDPRAALRSGGYGLYPSFVDGWLDVAPPTVTLIDGCESAYLYRSRLQYLTAAVEMKGACQNLVAPENRAKYRAQVQTSFGIYLDAYVNPKTSPWYLEAEEGKPRVEKLRENVTNALDIADEYVWLYGEKYRWFDTPNKGVNAQRWPEVLPGADTVLALAADSRAWALDKLAKLHHPVNLVANGDFTLEQVAATLPTPKYTGGLPAGWGFWQEPAQGKAEWDKAVGAGAPGSGRMTKVRNGCLISGFEVKPGEHYWVTAKRKLQGNGDAWLRVRWHDAQGRWYAEERDKLIFTDAPRDGWGELADMVTVPEGAAKLDLLLLASGQETDQDVVWYDDVAVYKLD